MESENTSTARDEIYDGTVFGIAYSTQIRWMGNWRRSGSWRVYIQRK